MRRLLAFFRRLFKARPKPQPLPKQAPRGIEPLESRIAPATLVNPTTVTFQDHDGDLVTVKSSKPIFTPVLVDSILQFDTGSVSGSNALAQQLQLVDLTKVSSSSLVANATLKITAKKAGSGNGLVDVGYINATNISLGAISVGGDLGRIDAGIVTNAVGLKSLTVNSLGMRLIADTQQAGGNLNSRIVGELGALTVKTDVVGAFLKTSNTITNTPGRIGSITIGGSLIGGAADSTGLITSAADIGAIKITGNITGGTSANTGAIFAAGKIGNVTVLESITGDMGAASGSIVSGGDMGKVTITGELHGGVGDNSGQIHAAGRIASVTIGDSLVGGIGKSSGAIVSGDTIGPVSIKHDVKGDAGAKSGGIFSGNAIGAITIGGSLVGGTDDYTGFISAATNIGAVKITNDIVGTAKLDTGAIVAGGKISSLTINGSLKGGAGFNSGFVYSDDDLGAVKVGLDVLGNAGPNSGQIGSGANIKSVTIGKSLTGGSEEFSGAILSGGTIGTVRIGTNVQGMAGDNSGQISSGTSLGAVTIGGSLLGGIGENSGGIFSHTLLGSDEDVQGNIGAVKITGSIIGNTGPNSGQINAAGNLASVSVGLFVTNGSILSGSDWVTSGTMGGVTIGQDFEGGVIQSSDSIGAISIHGKLSGSAAEPVVISARGQAVQTKTDLAIKSLSVGGDVLFAKILAGYDLDLTAVNPDAQIGAVKINGAWTASNLIAGAQDVNADGFGNADDAKISGTDNASIFSKIASVVIKGAITGTAVSGDHFGFDAQQIGSFKFGTATVTPLPGVAVPLNGTTDVSLFEIV